MTASFGPRFLACFALVAAAPLCAGQVSSTKARPPSKRECEKRIQSYLAAHPRDPDFRAKEAELFELLARVPALRKSDVKSWRKKVLGFHRAKRRGKKGARTGLRRLEKSGRNWFWDEPQRGLYFVGGNTKRPKGLLIGLHGGGKGSGDASSSFGAYRAAASKLGLVLVCPEVLVKSELGWTTDGTEDFVMELVDCALRTWKLDPNRVYFTGHSMGGYGSWTLGAHHADRVAAIAPSAGAPTPVFDIRDRKTILDMQSGVIPSLRNVRAVIFQSTDDPRVPPGPNQYAVKLLGEAKARWGGFDYEYLEVSDRGHGFPVGGPRVLLDKIVTHKREMIPERITWQAALASKRQFYWLWWDEPVLEAIVVADLDRAKNAVAITCEKDGKAIDASGLRVLLDPRVLDLQREVRITINAREVFHGVPERSLQVIARSGRHPDADRIFEAAAPPFPKRPASPAK